MPGGAGRSGLAWIVLIIAAVLSLGADLGSKWAAFHYVAGAPVEISREDVRRVYQQDPRLVTTLIPDHKPVDAIPGVLQWQLVLNPGAVFGVGPGQRWFFVGFTGVALGFGLWMFSKWTGPRDTAAHVGIGMLIGGGLGNLYDRLHYGVVRDFIHPIPGMRWPSWFGPLGGKDIWPYVSNIADLLLLIGIAILLWYLWKRDKAAKPVVAA